MKVAIVYDRINKWGGAERVILALSKIFPSADFYTSVYNEVKAPWAKNLNVRTSFLQKFPFASSLHEYYATLMPLAFESLDLSNYDLVISVTSEFAKGIITKPESRHICYMLTPTRYLWSGFDIYFKNTFLKFISKPIVSYLKSWDKIAAYRPDEIIAISREVKQRIKKYYKMDSKIIFPPIQIADLKPFKRGEYFLVVARLVPYKRVELAVDAFNDLGIHLKIVGSGSQENSLKKRASGNIEFIKNLTDDKLFEYYRNCKALIFPGIEDFGLVMAEAQSFGKPVIAFKGGGALDIVKEGVTGEFFDEQNKESLKRVVEKFDPKLYNDKLCRKNATRFAFENFKKEFLSLIN